MVRVNWTFQARKDLKNIFDYISKDSRQYAKLQVVRIKSRTKLLATQPFIGIEVPEISNSEIRQIVEGKYRIIYRVIDNSRIDILTIHHSARDFAGRIQEFE